MLETSARLLRLLSLLQTRPDWTGQALADRLQVSARTIRSDVDKLRRLGYPVHATPGVAGGYRLGAGAALPPLLLDDEEAVAVAVGLRTAAGGTVTGIEETSLRALAKLEQVLPTRLRGRVNALHTHIVAASKGGPTVDAAVLTTIAATARDRQRLRFDYRTHDGSAGIRSVEPHRLVHTGRRWYLLAWDTDRQDWRTFRVDRIAPRAPTGPRFAARQPPGGDAAAFVARSLDTALFRCRARVTVHAPAQTISQRVPQAVLVEALDDRTCVVHAGADTPHQLALHLLMLDTDFKIDEPPELIEVLRLLGGRLANAVNSSERSSHPRQYGPVAVYRLRPVADRDSRALYELHRAALGEYVAAVYGPWRDNEQAAVYGPWRDNEQKEFHRRWFARGGAQVIECGGELVGVLDTEERPDEISIGRIEIAPAYQRRGLGTAVLSDVIARADSRGLGVVLEVLDVNPARRLYERLGFRETARVGRKIHMRLTRL